MKTYLSHSLPIATRPTWIIVSRIPTRYKKIKIGLNKTNFILLPKSPLKKFFNVMWTWIWWNENHALILLHIHQFEMCLVQGKIQFLKSEKVFSKNHVNLTLSSSSKNNRKKIHRKPPKDKTEIGIKFIHQAPTKFSSVSFLDFIQKSSSSSNLFGSYTDVSFLNKSSTVTLQDF